MKTLETKINLLVALALADDDASRKTLKETLREHMLQEPAPEEPKPMDVGAEIEASLREIGVPCSLTGHGDLVVGLHLMIERPGIEEALTKELYPTIAEIRGNGRTPERVERAIRHAIETAWSRCDIDVLCDIFGNTVSISKGKPTNGEFITQLACHLRRRLKQ